jgi:hypothetical protein
MKLCKRCGNVKPLNDFYRRLEKEARCRQCVSELRKLKYKEDPEKQKERARNYRTRNPEKIRDTKLKQSFGVGLEYFNKKYREQNGVCAGCGKPETTFLRGTLLSLAIDHNHKTGQLRGLLCMRCNLGLGSLDDSIETLENLIVYLKKYKN